MEAVGVVTALAICNKRKFNITVKFARMRQNSVIFRYSGDIFAGMKWFRLFLCIMLGVFFFSSCEIEKEPDVAQVCDPGNPVTYTNSISQIISNNCLKCHFSGGNVPNLHNFSAVHANSEKILKAVNHESGALFMPQGASKLDANLLNKFRCWSEAGFKE